MAFPGVQLVLLCRADGARNYLENILWRCTAWVLRPDGNSNHQGSADLPHGLRGNRRDQATIGKAPCSDLYRFEKPWISATRANGLDQRALSKDHGIAAP